MKYNRLIWVVGAGILCLWLFYQLTPILTPFVIGAILAYLVDPLVNKLTRIRLPRPIAVTIVFVTLVLLILLLLLLLIPLLEAQVVLFINHLPQMISWLQNTLIPWISQFFNLDEVLNVEGLKNVLLQHLQQAGNIATILMQTISKSSISLVFFFIDLFLIPVVTFYLLKDWDRILVHVRRLFPRKFESVIVQLLRECDEVLGAFFRGQLIVMLSLGIYYTLGLWLVGLQLALLIGIIIGLISIVPYVGFTVGIIIAMIATAVQFQNWISIIYVLIVFIVGQILEGTVLTPLLVGDRIGLHPVVVIFAIMAGGQLFGFFGVLLALPVAAVIMVLLRHLQRQYFLSDFYRKKKVAG